MNKIFLDMDGVLTDFSKKLAEILDKPLDRKFDFGNDPKIWKKIDEAGEKFWSEMEWMPDGRELWDYLKKHKITILSSPSDHHTSIKGKKLWLKENLPKIPFILEQNKAKYAVPSAILIDDRAKNIKKWEEAGGVGILHKSAKDTIKKIEKIMEKEKEASVDYAGKVKTASVMEVVNGYLSKIAVGTSVMDAPSPAQSKWEQFLKSQGRGEGTPAKQRPSSGNFVQKTDKRIMHAIQDLMAEQNFDNIKAKEVWGNILRLREMDPALIDSEKRAIQNSMIQIESEDILELLGYVLKDDKSWKDYDAAMRLISRIKNNLGITPDAPKATDPFKSTPTEMVMPSTGKPLTRDEWLEKKRRMEEMAKQRMKDMPMKRSKRAQEILSIALDRVEQILKTAGLI